MKFKIIFCTILAIAFFLRIFALQHNPPGFYSDEASYAYNAYSILKTGRDEHGVFLPLTTEAFGDYKLPVMLYSLVGSFALFGPSDWAARLPGVIYGTASLIALYLLIKEMGDKKYHSLGLIAIALLAITPAHIFVSRGTWELTPALFFILTGTILFIKSLKQQQTRIKSSLYMLASALSFVLSIYAYNSARVFVPLFGVILLIHYRSQFMQYLKSRPNQITLMLTVLIVVILCFPIIKAFRTPEVTQRAKYISIFYDKGVEARLFDAIRSDSGQPVKLTQLLHNKPLFYFMDFSKRYLSHFDPNFLFITGDTFEIFQMEGLGFLPLLALPFLVIGAYTLVRDRPQWMGIIISWLLISPIASSFTIFTPSISRAQNMVIPLVIITAYGIREIFKYRQALIPMFILLYLINISYIFHQYFFITPKYVAEKWNDGFKSEVEYVNSVQDKYEKIYISSSQAPSYIFYAWYMKYDPATFQHEVDVDHTPDQNGLTFTRSFGKIYFTKDIATMQKTAEEGEKLLFVGFQNELRNPDLKFYSRNHKVSGEAKDTL